MSNSHSTLLRCRGGLPLRWFPAFLLLVVSFHANVSSAERKEKPFPPLYRLGEVFETAIATEKFDIPPGRQVTGITVPHHLLAPDLIARGFHLASGNRYDRILLLSPDHFRRAQRPFATTSRDFRTALGPVATDSAAVAELIEGSALVEESNLFDREHGIQAILPFIAHFFPGTRIVPIAIRGDSRESDWRQLVDALVPLVTERTLLIQSTDFSHYLPEPVAARRDQETMNLLATGDPRQLSRLSQPDHLDSLGAQWIHQAIQAEVFQADLTLVAHRNSNDYSATPLEESTSYLVQVYEKNAATQPPWPPRDGESLVFLAGDTFLGRHFTPIASDPIRARRIQEKILRMTGGFPLIVNLEGVLSSAPSSLPNDRHLVMPEALTLEWLRSLNVVGASIANNHAHDRGEEGWLRTRDLLRENGIAAIGDGETHDFGKFQLAAFTDLSNRLPPHTQRLDRGSVEAVLPLGKTKPIICFLHWGREWEGTPGPREEALSELLFDAGASVLIGSHPHTAGTGLEAFRGGRCARAYSLGNFLFDQRDPRASGALLEVRFFESGNYALRWIPIGNLFTN